MTGRIVALTAGIAAALAVAAPSAMADPLATFSYEGDSIEPPWYDTQAPPDRISVAASPTDSSKKVMRVELRNGDDFLGANRAEVYGRFGNVNDYSPSAWPDGDGTERWYGWSTYLNASFPSPPSPNWTVVAQWHSMAHGVPPLALVVQEGKLKLNAWDWTDNEGAVPLWNNPPNATTGTWHTFVMHVKWSALPGVGFVELWHNGNDVPAVPKTYLPTEKCCAVQGTSVWPYPNFLKMGIYRNPEIQETGVLFHGPRRIGLDKDSVRPPSPGG